MSGTERGGQRGIRPGRGRGRVDGVGEHLGQGGVDNTGGVRHEGGQGVDGRQVTVAPGDDRASAGEEPFDLVVVSAGCRAGGPGPARCGHHGRLRATVPRPGCVGRGFPGGPICGTGSWAGSPAPVIRARSSAPCQWAGSTWEVGMVLRPEGVGTAPWSETGGPCLREGKTGETVLPDAPGQAHGLRAQRHGSVNAAVRQKSSGSSRQPRGGIGGRAEDGRPGASVSTGSKRRGPGRLITRLAPFSPGTRAHHPASACR